ncbi:MAG: SAM-dependent methyltransferase [Ruminococcaceae bacterium]|nr:SAM-dependent methyltransferase [Oscillospiraceae bacterium]
MNKALKLSKRLRAAADLVRQDAYIADVGTDHAYLPIALCLEGRVKGAVASDINEGPILRAREHISAYGLDTRIDTVLADGLDEIGVYKPTDILILGMGGELIANIISRASFVKDGAIRLILQPMTHPEILRRFLLDNGYAIIDENLVLEEKKVYQVICAEYTGETQEYSDVELLLGKKNIERGGELLLMSVERFISVFSERLRGKKMSGADTTEEEKILAELEELK